MVLKEFWWGNLLKSDHFKDQEGDGTGPELAQDHIQHWALVLAKMNLWVLLPRSLIVLRAVAVHKSGGLKFGFHNNKLPKIILLKPISQPGLPKLTYKIPSLKFTSAKCM